MEAVMLTEEQLRDRLRKVEALYARAGTPGERRAAGEALSRLKATLAEIRRAQQEPPSSRAQQDPPNSRAQQDSPVELRVSIHNPSLRCLFEAVCQKHGVRIYRKPRQRRTTVIVRAPEQWFRQIVWKEFLCLQADLRHSFEQATQKAIAELKSSMH
jgi:hypothetical protein